MSSASATSVSAALRGTPRRATEHELMEPNVTDIPEVPEYVDLHLDNAWNGPNRERFLSSMAVNNREPDLGSQGTGATRARVVEEMIEGAANILYDSIRDSTSPDITALETHVNKTFETIFSLALVEAAGLSVNTLILKISR